MKRYLPDKPLPPYSYVPNQFPHPVSHPDGHGFYMEDEPVDSPSPEHWKSCQPYLLGLDLFNFGYYWEAHEVWEGIWHACGRRGTTADFVKGLIKLAAAGVKLREGKPAGLVSHAERATELFQLVRSAVKDDSYFGLPLDDLSRSAMSICEPFEPRHSDIGLLLPITLIATK